MKRSLFFLCFLMLSLVGKAQVTFDVNSEEGYPLRYTVIDAVNRYVSVESVSKTFASGSFAKITIPATVKEVKENAFQNNRLTTITFEGTTPPLKSNKDNNTIFAENRIQHIYVPASSVAAYKALFPTYQSYITAK